MTKAFMDPLLVCRRGHDHPQPIETRKGWRVCSICWGKLGVISLVVPQREKQNETHN